MIKSDNYDNGYNSSDFKRNAQQDAANDSHQDGEDGGVKLNEKAGEYMREVLAEKIRLSNGKFPISTKLIDQEVVKVQASGRAPGRDQKYLDVYKEKPAKVSVKVLVPLKEHPKFNFVGKLLGPKGNTMKQLQEETMCKMAVLGRGSMRDRQKEEELRNSLDPKYSHLTDELHVEITSIAPPAEAHARIAYALAEVKKYLIPDPPEGPGGMMWGQPPMDREMMPMPGRGGPHGRPPPRAPARMAAPPMPRLPPKTKVISILDRARSAMETNYSYDDPYGAPEPPMRVPPRGQDEFYYDRAPERFYEDEPYYKDESRNDYKQASSREVGTRRPQAGGPQRHHGAGGHNAFSRAQPYGNRPQKSQGKPQRN